MERLKKRWRKGLVGQMPLRRDHLAAPSCPTIVVSSKTRMVLGGWVREPTVGTFSQSDSRDLETPLDRKRGPADSPIPNGAACLFRVLVERRSGERREEWSSQSQSSQSHAAAGELPRRLFLEPAGRSRRKSPAALLHPGSGDDDDRSTSEHPYRDVSLVRKALSQYYLTACTK